MSGTFKHWKLALAAAGLYFGLAGSACAQADRFYQRELVSGAAEAYVGDCPDFLPSAPMSCTEWDLLLFKSTYSEGGAGLAPPQGAWRLRILHHTLTFDGVDVTETNVGIAVVPVSDYTFDIQHLTSAGVNLEHATLDDGTPVSLTAIWTAKSDRIVYGNDSPINSWQGLPTHFHGPCFTTNNLGNERVRAARMSAVINNVGYEYDGLFGVILTGNFVYMSVVPASCN